jgi:phosphinothricin acetyltransferase
MVGRGAVRVRPASRSDLPALVALYNHYVEHTPITFDTEPWTVEARTPWFDAFSPDGPHRLLVAEQDGIAAGYASSTTFRAKRAYHRTVETTVYVHVDHTRRGIGCALYEALLDAMHAEPDVHRALAGITLPNPGSVALHERLGFRTVGTFTEVGWKFGRYWDVRWYEREV